MLENGCRIANDVNGAQPILDLSRLRLLLKAGTPLPAHALTNGLSARGQIEPLLGRETKGDRPSFGSEPAPAQQSRAPGPLIEEEAASEIQTLGTWRKVLPA